MASTGMRADRRALAALGQAAAEVAHEGANVLHTFRLTLEVLRRLPPGDPKASALIDRLVAGEARLDRLFRSVCHDAAGVRIDPRWCDLHQIWRAAHQTAAQGRPGTRLALRERVTAETGCEADPELLEGVFRNLFENAAAVSPQGVCVRLSCRPAAARGRPGVRIVVRDDGPGLTAAERARVFDSFYTTRPGGTGLGLGIARRTVRAHGGELSVLDRDGPGAAFVIRLPRAIPARP